MVLEMPLDLAGIAIQRKRRGCIQVITRPLVAEPRRTVAGAPINGVRSRIVIPGHPGGRAAGLPGIGLLPCFAAGLARGRNGIGLPRRLAGVGIERLDKAAHAELAPRHADKHLALHDQRRHRHVVTGLPVLDLGLPRHLAGLGIERHQLRIQRREEHLVAIQRDAAAGVVQRAEAFRQPALVAPQQRTRGRIQRHHLAVRRATNITPSLTIGGDFMPRIDAR